MAFKVGDKVRFGRPNGEQTVGTIVKVNPSRLKVRQDEVRGSLRVRPEGTIWNVAPSLCTLVGGTAVTAPAVTAKAPRRPEAVILDEIRGVYCALSPENLHCDGEISRTAAARKAVILRAQLRNLEVELGRKVSECDALGIPDAPRTKPAPLKTTFKVGDKVSFPAKGVIVTGFVQRINTRTVAVAPVGAAPNAYWRVSPSLLQPA